MKQHNKNLTLKKETLTNLQENNIKGGFVKSWDLPCMTNPWGKKCIPDVSMNCTDSCAHR